MRLRAYVFILAAAAVGQVPDPHHPPSSGEYARVLDDPSRDEWQKPHEVVLALGLKSTDIIADIGAGTGYFARRFAGHEGEVYAVDIDRKLLDIVRKNAPANLTASCPRFCPVEQAIASCRPRCLRDGGLGATAATLNDRDQRVSSRTSS